jgi:small nuclear ribonucleoprotein (snRNP)-like protein
MFRRFRSNRALRRFSYRSISVVMLDGTTIRGVLHDSHGDVLVMLQASTPTPERGDVPLDGLTVIERRHVRFVQVLDPQY